jgi:hypothetical protein
MSTPQHLRADATPPRNGLIALYTAITVTGLLLLKPIFDSYFAAMFGGERERKIATAPTSQLDAHRARDRELLEVKGVPIDRAISQLARGRAAAPALVAPLPSEDTGALVGWQHLPDFVFTADKTAGAEAAAATGASGSGGAANDGSPSAGSPADGHGNLAADGASAGDASPPTDHVRQGAALPLGGPAPTSSPMAPSPAPAPTTAP